MLNVFELSPFTFAKKAAQTMEKELVTGKQTECDRVMHNDSSLIIVVVFGYGIILPIFATCNNH